jgi:V/A-type H+-transporting ATPase subunit A
MKKTGRIKGISGATVTVELSGLKLYERVYVGHAMLTGEVVRLEKGLATIQVYEDTRGLGIGEPVKGTGMPLSVRLGPGLLGGMFDGLQRPLDRFREELGPFIKIAKEMYALDYARKWKFHPLKNKGDALCQGEAFGYIDEGAFRHYVLYEGKEEGKIESLREGELTLGDSFGKLEGGTLEGGRELFGCHEWPVREPRPYKRKLTPVEPLVTGQRSIDFLYPLSRGGTAVLPGGFGTGKTVLEQSIAKFADVDIVVYVGCGERGNEMAELIGEFTELNDRWSGRKLMERTVLIANTSNMPVAAREASIYAAVTIGEYFRDMGYNVLLLADSLSRWAEALREISSSLEEMPGEEGYPTYLASRLSAFFERAGVVETLDGRQGSLSMILSVSPPGGDFTEPVSQACLRMAGAFLMLDTALAHSRHFPAINWFQSYSLYDKKLSAFFSGKLSPEWTEMKKRCRECLQAEQGLREITEIVGFEGLQEPDRLLMKAADMIKSDFLCQSAYGEEAFSAPEDTLSKIKNIFAFYEQAMQMLEEGAPLEEILKTGAEIAT